MEIKATAAFLLLFGSLALPCCSDDKADKCEGAFADVTRACPRTFDGTLVNLSACEPYPAQSVRTCGDLIVLTFEGGFTGAQCFFDFSSHEVVGAKFFSDISDFCGMTSFTQQAGKVPDSSCNDTAPALRKDCNEPPDAGTDSSCNALPPSLRRDCNEPRDAAIAESRNHLYVAVCTRGST